MKRKAKSLLLIGLLLLLLLFIGYFLLAYYYREGFSLNTWINGVYCTGKTVEEVNAELLLKTEAPIVIVKDRNGETYPINMAEADYQMDYMQPLKEYMKEQNSLQWIDNIFFHSEHQTAPVVYYDEKLLRKLFEKLEPIVQEQQKRTDYVLEHDEEKGYYIYDGLSSRLDTDKAFQALKEAVATGAFAVDLGELDCYYDIPLTQKQQEIKELYKQLEWFQNCNLVYDMGDAMIPLDAAVMSKFVKTVKEEDVPEVLWNDDGTVLLDEEAVTGFISALAEEYDTFEKEREFQSTRGDIITVKGVTYGTELDQKAEVKYLMEQLLLEESHTETPQYHVPTYKHEAVVRGKDDIGTTYIEIDMTEQKMYYYESGELKLETEVVTGNTGRRWGTPEGINFVYSKQRNRVLRGEGYASPVKYWMPVKGNIGIHDANWRSEFGGTIYQTNGSHGCINTPTEKMAELYEMVEIGTPVIMFY